MPLMVSSLCWMELPQDVQTPKTRKPFPLLSSEIRRLKQPAFGLPYIAS